MPVKKTELVRRSFRELMDEFEATCAQFDTDSMDIERALELHGKAGELLDELEQRLRRAEEKIKKTKD